MHLPNPLLEDSNPLANTAANDLATDRPARLSSDMTYDSFLTGMTVLAFKTSTALIERQRAGMSGPEILPRLMKGMRLADTSMRVVRSFSTTPALTMRLNTRTALA